MGENHREATTRAEVNLERHLRAAFYALVSFSLSLLGYFAFGFGRTQAIGYCASAFVVLVLLNRRAMLGRVVVADAITDEKA